MNITVWGCRGSLPTPGEGTARYGGNTTCLEIRLDDDTLLVVDAGSGIRGLAKKIMSEGGAREIFFFITHSHWDHLMGFPFFIPAYVEGFKVHVRGGPLAKRSLKNYLAHQMQPPYFPITFDMMKARFDFTDSDPKIQEIGSAVLTPIRLNHPNGGYGFRLNENGRSFVFLTDNELDMQYEKAPSFADYVAFCEGVDLLIHDAQYTDEDYRIKAGWGHSTLGSVARLARESGVKRLGLFHHDPDRTDDGVDRCVEECRKRLDDAGAGTECFGSREGMTVAL